jgi:hypothetical protein
MTEDVPERMFILASIRRHLPGADLDGDLAPLLQGLNWDRLLWIAVRMRVQLWIRDALEMTSAQRVCPPAVRSQLDAVRQAAHMRSLSRTREMCLIQDRFDKVGIPALSVDGWTFAQCFYPNPGFREPGGSLGWMVQPQDLERCRTLLAEEGYDFGGDPLRLSNPNRTLLRLRDRIGGMDSIDASQRDRLWSSPRSISLGGRMLRTLAPAHWLIHLCGRAAEAGAVDPIRAFDLLTAWSSIPEGQHMEILAEADRFGLRSPVVGALTAAHRRFQLPVPGVLDRGPGGLVVNRKMRYGNVLSTPTPDTELSYLGRFSPTPVAVANAMLELAETGPEDVVFDLGCGNGRLLVAAARRFGAKAVGVDIDPVRIEEARASVAAAGVAGRVSLSVGDLMGADVSAATVVCLYIQGFAMDGIRRKLESEARPGTRIVSHNFVFPGWPPERTRIVRAGLLQAAHIYLWKIG